MVRSALIASLACSAAAFAPSQVGRAASAVSETKADLEAIAEKSNPVLKFYDPLELSDTTIFVSCCLLNPLFSSSVLTVYYLSNFAWVSLLASLQLAGNISFWSTTKFDRTILNES